MKIAGKIVGAVCEVTTTGSLLVIGTTCTVMAVKRIIDWLTVV